MASSTLVASPWAAAPGDLDLERALEVGQQRAHVGVRFFGLLRRRPLDHRGERRRDLRAALLDVRHLLVDVLHRHADQGVRLERHLAGQHLVEQDAERVDVAPGVDLLAHRLLGRDVVGGARAPARSW